MWPLLPLYFTYCTNCLLFIFSCTGKKRLKDLLLQKDNRYCADCGAPDPKWA